MKKWKKCNQSYSIRTGNLSCNHIVIHLYPFVNTFLKKNKINFFEILAAKSELAMSIGGEIQYNIKYR